MKCIGGTLFVLYLNEVNDNAILFFLLVSVVDKIKMFVLFHVDWILDIHFTEHLELRGTSSFK